MMHSRTAPDGIFSSLNDLGDEEVGYSAHQLPKESLARMASFTDTQNVADDAFLSRIWAMVLRQYVGSDDVCFRSWKIREDGPGEEGPGLPRHQLEGCIWAVNISPQETIEEFWKRSQTLTYVKERTPDMKYNTGIVVREGGIRTDTAVIFEEVRKRQEKDSLEIQVLLVLETTADVHQQLTLLSRTSALSEDQARHVAWTVSHAISEATSGLSRQMADLHFLSAEDRALMLEWNKKTFRDAAHTLLIPEVIHKQSERQPNAVAISSWDGELTFAELEAYASRLAVLIRHAGVKPRALVPIIFEKSRWAVVSQLAILMAGAAFVPLEPTDPDDRLRLIVRKVQATVLVTSEKHKSRCTPWAPIGITVSPRLMVSLPSSNDAVSSSQIDRLAPAYVLFTSGSTGEPKGVIINHEAMAQISRQSTDMGLVESSRVLQFAAYSFTMAIIEIYMGLAAGATICIPSDHDRMNRLHEAMEELKISWAVFTPSVLRNLDANNPPSRLKTVITGGEPLGKVEFLSWFGKVVFLNGYGMSENAGVTALARLTSVQADLKAFTPYPSTRLWLVNPDDHDHLVPIGAVGELVLEGQRLTKGYLENPDATAQAFIDSPPWRVSMNDTLGRCGHLYKAGDLFRYTMQGELQYIGRKSTQLKIRGKRVDVNEVEAVLREVCKEGMRVVVEGSSPLGEIDTTTLVAFLCSSGNITKGTSPAATSLVGEPSTEFRSDVSIIRSKIQTRLPEHMQPTLYIPLAYVPHTVTGKIARRALREVVQQRSREELDSYQSVLIELIPASTANEKMLHDLFVQVLGLDGSRFGIYHDFIKLGGDSLGAMRLVNLLRSRGHTVTVADIMRLKTIARIAEVLGDLTHSPNVASSANGVSSGVSNFDGSNIEGLTPSLKQAIIASGVKSEEDVQEVLPCSPTQQGLLLSHARNPELYQNRIVWEVTSEASSEIPDINQLQAAWGMVCIRHPILRTIFVESSTAGGLAVQVVLKPTCPGVCFASFAMTNVTPLGHAQPLYHSHTGMSWLPRLQVMQGAEDRIYCVLDIHHAFMDAFSMTIIERDFRHFYNIKNEEYQDTTNGSFKLQKWYGDYIRLLPSTTPDTDLAFWKSELMGIEPCLFPQSAGHNEQESMPRLHSVHVDLGTDISRRLRSFCMEIGVTAASVFKLAWALVLKAFTGSSGVCFGYMTANRDQQIDGIENIVGPFIQTLPCYLRLDPQESLFNTVNRLQADFVRALPHQQPSLADIQHALGLRGQGLFNTTMTFVPETPNDTETPSITLRRIEVEGPTEYDLVLEVEASASKFECNIRYWSNFMSKERAPHVAGVMSSVLRQIMQDPHISIGNTELLCSQDKQQIAEWNKSAPMASDRLLHDLILMKCWSQPAALAVQAWDGTLTYQELDKLSSILAVELQGREIVPDVFVPICMDRSRWTLVAVLAVTKAGGAFCLLDPSHPSSRLSEICQSLAATIILVGEGNSERGAELRLPSLVVGNRLCETQECRALSPVHVSPSHALYAVFTSGSTGKPKGVILEHRSFCSTALSCPGPLQLRVQDRTLHFASYAFDVSVIEVIVPLVVGACVCIPSEEDRLNHLQRVVREFNVSWAFLTPTVARLLQPDQLLDLRTLVLGGEAVLASDFDTWSPWVNLVSAYSPAECTPVGLATTVDRVSPNRLGWAFRSLRSWIVDPGNYQKLAPLGAIGELVIEGPVVGRGYLHDLESSLPNSPFIEAPAWLHQFPPGTANPRLYRTGDLVHYEGNGAIRFLGRKDSQVKVHGQRLEPGEVEYNIRLLLPWARTVIVEPVVLSRKSTDAVVVAFISKEEPDPGQGPSMAPELALRDDTFFTQAAMVASRLRDCLPHWMIPTIFFPLGQIPLTKSGKVNRRRLKELVVNTPLEQLQGIQEGHRSQPATDMERRLQGLFSKVLHVPRQRIWADSDFFILGGDSVGAMRLVSAGTELGLDLTVAKIFKHPILRNLAEVASISNLRGHRDEAIPQFSLISVAARDKILQLTAQQCDVSVDEIEDVYPCTPLQEALMAATAKDPDMYTARFIYDVADGVDLGRLQNAWQATVDRNAILRTRVVEALPYGTFQVVLRDSRTRIKWLRYQSTKSYDDFEASAAAMGLGISLLRLSIISETGCPERIAVTLHHAIYDGASLRLMLEQVDSVYNGQSIQYAPFNKFVKYLEEQDRSIAANFWRAQFAGVEAPVFPQIPSTVDLPQATEYLEVETLIRPDWKHSGVTLATSIRLAWAILTSYYSDSNVVVFGDTVTGRALPIDNIDNICGPTIATVPFLVHVKRDQSLRDALFAVQAQATHMVQYEATGLQNIRRASPEAAASCNFQTQLVIESPDDTTTISSTIVPRRHPSITAAFSSYALVLVFTPSRMSNKIKVEAQFDAETMHAEFTSRLLDQFGHVLGQVCSGSGQRIRDVQVNSSSDIRLLKQWNQTLPQAYEHTVHELVLHSARTTPKKLAIDSWDGRLTYDELDSASALVGQAVMGAGVRLGDRVALSFARSKWAVIAMLGVLRAGATCVNIDPALPSGRISQILDLSQPVLFLASPEAAPAIQQNFAVPTLSIPSIIQPKEPLPWPATRPEGVSFIIFTSGSTGAPKGIVLEHVNLASSIHYHSHSMGAHPDMRSLHFGSYAFDIIIPEVFTTWVQGGCVCIPSDTDRLSNLAGFMEQYHVNWAIMTPSTVSALQPEDVPTLERLVLGGEPVPTDLVHVWGSKVDLINAYGPAEASVSCAGGPLVPGESSFGLIGTMAGAVGWITVPGDTNRLAPVGAVGELLIEGPLVARGYYQQPERTRQAFIDPPQWLRSWRSGSSPGRLFRSGDLVQYDGNGRFKYVGRKDMQVKLRGQRVELTEVERHLRAAFPETKNVVAEVIHRGPRSHNPDLLVAFLNFNSAACEDKTMGLFQDRGSVYIADFSTRLQRLEGALPAYMVPAAIVSVVYMPYTTSGKIDRRVLRDSAESLAPLELQSVDLLADRGTVEQPQNEEESRWQQLWSQVLSVAPETLGRDDDFFRIGSDSIGAMKLSSLARRKGLEITVADIFKHPRLKDMAAVAKPNNSTTATIDPFALVPAGTLLDGLIEGASRICEVPPTAILDIYPATPIQAGLLALTSQEVGAYVALYSYELPEDIDIERLRVAWNRAAEAHSILRTRLIQSGSGATYQVVINEPLNWHQHEQGHLDAKQLCYPVSMGSPLLHLIYAPRCVESSECAQLFVSIHHALYDGWSWPLLLQEVERAYQGAQLEYTPFTSFVEHVQSSMEEAAVFWGSKMNNVDPVSFPALPSPSYHPRPASTMSTIVSLPASRLPPHVTLATKCKLSWALLAGCYRNKSDVVYGIISSGRAVPVAGIERIIGPTMATTPLRFYIDPDQKVQEALEDIQHSSWKASTFEHFGIQNIRQQGEGARAACKFQTQLVLQPEQPELSVSWFKSQRTLSSVQQFSDCALTLTCLPIRDSLEVSAVFDSNILSPEQVERVIWQFEHTLAQLETVTRNTTIRDLDMLNNHDWETLKTLSPDLAPYEQCAHEAIQHVCFNQRHEPAVDAWDGQWTYRELDIQSTYLARRLARQGVTRNKFVGLYFHKSRWTVVAQLAVLKAGGAITMLDPSHPPQRLRRICDMIEPACILVYDKRQAMDIALNIPIVGLEDILNNMEVSEDHMPFKTETTRTDAMFSIATSGTTGTPKIMIIEHGAFMASAQSFVPRFGLNQASRVIQFTGYSFDAVYIDHLGTLLAGGCICIPSPSDRDNRLAKVMTDMRVNWAILTTSVIQVLSPSAVPSLRTLVQAGEPMTQGIVDTWAPHVRLLNGYGPSECTIISCIKDAFSTGTSPGNIGYSSGCVCWITDPDNIERLVPIGAEGELIIEGPILARGYLNDPERTAKAFVERPSWLRAIRQGQQCDETRVYRTGDIVKYRSSGELIYLARKDNQVKLRGQRIELGGIENHVQECFPDAVQVVAEVATLRGSNTETLIAFVLTSQSRQPSEDQELQGILYPATQVFMDGVRAAEHKLHEQVPSYMIPGLFLPVLRIPWNANGKADRPLLRRLVSELSRDSLDGYQSSKQVCPPTTDMERKLQAIWAHVLNVSLERVGIHDSFFTLGGDSVTCMQVASQCQSISIAVTVKDIFKHRTIASLASHADECSISVSQQPNGALSNGDNSEEVYTAPLSPIQQLFFEHSPQGHNHFNQSFFLRVNGNASNVAIQDAIGVIVKTHSMFRSRFDLGPNGRWTQRISASEQTSYQYCSHTVKTQREIGTLCETSQRSLDIRRGPLLWVNHFTMANSGERYLFLVAHHLVVDLVSWRIVLTDLEDIIRLGKTPSVPATSFTRWCQVQVDRLAQRPSGKVTLGTFTEPDNLDGGEVRDGYWGEYLPNNYGDFDVYSITIDERSSSLLLGDANRPYQTQPVELIHAAILYAFVQIFHDRPAPTIFTEGHGRDSGVVDLDITRTVGWFTNIWPVPVSLNADDSILEAVKRTKDRRRQTEEDNSTCLATGRAQSRRRVPMEILFNFLGQFQQLERSDAMFTINGAQPPASNVADDMRRFALVDISVSILNGRLELHFFINRNMKHQSALRRWVHRCEESLKEIATTVSQASPAYTVSDFPLASLTSESIDSLMATVVPKCAGDIQDIYPCSPIQQGMLISNARNESLYNVTFRWKVGSTDHSRAVSVERLERAWQSVVDRHDALRTAFVAISDRGYLDQVVLKNVKATIEVHKDFQGLTQFNGNMESFAVIQPPHRLHIIESKDGQILLELHIHHALLDAASVQVIKRDFVLAYDGQLGASSAPSYRDYIAYLQSRASFQEPDSYWTDYLRGVTPSLLPRLADSGFDAMDPQGDAKVDSILLDIMSTDSVDRFCEAHNLSLTSLIHVAWAIVVNRFTAAHDVCFGYLTLGRHVPLPGIQNIVGPLINMLIGRVHLEPDAPLLPILQQYHGESLESLNHQHDSLAEVLHSTGMPAGDVLNTAVSIQRQRPNDRRPLQSTLSLEDHGGTDRSEYPVMLNFGVMTDRISLTLSYQTSFLSLAAANSIARTFRQVLSEVMRNPSGMSVRNIEALDEASKRHILDRNHIAQHPQIKPKLAPSAIRDISLKQPGLPAVAAWDGEFTYGELEDLSSALAEDLIYNGAQREQPIPLYFQKSCWTVVAMLATWKAGAPFVLLDASHPSARHRIICEEVNASMMVTSESNRSTAAGVDLQVIEVGPAWSKRISMKSHRLSVEVNPMDAAYVVFTSGTTGKPKGVLIEHENIATAAAAASPQIRLDSTSRVLQFAAYAWDASIYEIVFPLLVGGCVCIPSEDQRMGSLVAAANELGVNWATLTPTIARTLRADEFKYLKTLILAGEPLSVRDILDWHGSVHLMQAYGVSECSVINTVSDVLTPSSNVRNIGRPCGVQAWIVDRDDHKLLVPDGGIGELVLEGPSVGRGYLNEAELSSAAFIDRPVCLSSYNDARPTRLYKTGDLARYTSDGTLILVGRKDTQVKLRGQRFELGEVEHHVQAAFPFAQQVIADIVSGSEKSTTSELVVFIHDKVPVAESGSFLSPASESFRQATSAAVSRLQDFTPAFMIPTLFFPLAQVPRAVSGKVDRRKLRQHVASLSPAEREGYGVAFASRRTPQTPMEARLQHYVAQVLQSSSSDIPLDHNLFQSGLDSITAIHLVAMARKDGLDLSVPTVFQYPRLVDLAPCVRGLTVGQARIPRHAGTMAEVDIEALCSLWRLDRKQVAHVLPTTYFQRKSLEGGRPDYRVVHLSRHIDRARLRAAVESVMEKHSILRSIFIPYQDTIMSVVLSDVPLPFEEITTDQDPRSVCEAICTEDSRASRGINDMHFKVIFITAPDCMTLILRFHHAQYDGFCLPYLFKDIALAYEGLLSEAELDFPHYLTERLVHGRSPATLQFWRDTLHGSSMTYIGADGRTQPSKLKNSNDETIKSHSDFRLPTSTTSSRYSMATIAKAAWALCLAEQTNIQDLVFGQIVTGRTLHLRGIEGIIGPCVNTIPVRVSMQPAWTGHDLLKFLHEQTTLTMAHESIELDTLIKETTDWPATTTLGSVFQYETSGPKRTYSFLDGVGYEIDYYQFNPPRGYPHFSCNSGEDGMLGMDLLVPGDVWDQKGADRVLMRVGEMVGYLLAHPERPLKELGLGVFS